MHKISIIFAHGFPKASEGKCLPTMQTSAHSGQKSSGEECNFICMPGNPMMEKPARHSPWPVKK